MNKDKENLLNRWQKFDFYFYALKNGLNWKELHSERSRTKPKAEHNSPAASESVTNQVLGKISKAGSSQDQNALSNAGPIQGQGAGSAVEKAQNSNVQAEDDNEMEVSHNIAAYLAYLRDKDMKNNYSVDPLSRWMNALQKIRMLRHDYRNEWLHAFSNALEIKMNQIGEGNPYYRVYEFIQQLLYGNDIPSLEDCDEFTINILADLMQELSDSVNDPQILEMLLQDREAEVSPEICEPIVDEQTKKMFERLNSLPLFRNLKNFLDPFNMDPDVRRQLEEILAKISDKLDILEASDAQLQQEDEPEV